MLAALILVTLNVQASPPELVYLAGDMSITFTGRLCETPEHILALEALNITPAFKAYVITEGKLVKACWGEYKDSLIVIDDNRASGYIKKHLLESSKPHSI